MNKRINANQIDERTTMIINVLTITFNNEIKPHEVPLFRGAVINALDEKQVLFHNHVGDDGFRYRYPLIQYKRLGGKAAIVCVGEGTQAIGEFFASGNFNVMIGERNEQLQLERTEPRRCNIQVWEQMFRYRVEYLKDAANRDSLIREHDELWESLRRKDIDDTSKNMRMHIERQMDAIRELIANQL